MVHHVSIHVRWVFVVKRSIGIVDKTERMGSSTRWNTSSRGGFEQSVTLRVLFLIEQIMLLSYISSDSIYV